MAFSFLYLAFRAVLGALVRSRRGLDVKDIELLVLRHELAILRRQAGRPKPGPADRALLAAAAVHLPRPPELARVPAVAGSQHHRLRLPYRRDDAVAPLLRALLHSAREPPSLARRLHQESDGGVGDPAGAQPRPRHQRERRPLLDPRS